MSADAPRILVIRRRYLGDIVLLSPFFQSLRQHWPAAELTLLAEASYAAVATLIPEIDRTLILPRRARELGGWLTLVRALRAGRFTHVFDLDNREKTAALTRITGARERIALLHEAPPRLPFCYTRIVLDPPVDHERRSISEYYLQALAGAAVPVATKAVRLVPREADRASVAKHLGDSFPRLLVHPGSRSAFRVWPAESFAAICDRAQNELGAKVLLIGGPADQPLLAAIAAAARTKPDSLTTPLSVGEFAALAAGCDLMLCHDSGPMHVAAGVGTRVVALFGSQNTTVWRPAGENHVVLQAPLPCADCVAPAVCVPGDSYRNYCVRRLTVETVWTAVRAQLTSATPAR
ncbi:MAG TPA: glycosyltransferase family 9 protein [Opitutaceae bacterium]|nr:glycosyltransferase family 9 protein [Opitutaceae bacterium]